MEEIRSRSIAGVDGLISGMDTHEGVKSAREFFRSQGLPINAAGTVDTNLSEAQVVQLAVWRKERCEGGIEMVTPEDFYRKVYLAASLWPQVQGGETKYLFGKGIGVEIALRGEVRGREKRPVAFPYRTHSDFEFYGVRFEAAPNGGYISGEVYPEIFQRVFEAQEYFDPTRMKGVKGMSPNLLHDTAETVDFGGLTLKIPELELLFLDKWRAGESTPRTVRGQVMSDAEILARQYALDRQKIHGYLQQFIVQPLLLQAESALAEKIEAHFAAISRSWAGSRASIEEDGEMPTPESIAAAMNQRIDSYAKFPNTSVGGIRVGYWVPLEGKHLDEKGEIADQELRAVIIGKIEAEEKERIERIRGMGRELDTLLDAAA